MALRKTEETASAVSVSEQKEIVEKPKKSEAKNAEEKAAFKHPEKYILKHKLSVNGDVGIYIDGTGVSVVAKNGTIEFKDEADKADKICAALVDAGWTDETIYPINRPIAAPKPSAKVGKAWSFHHPDTHPNDPLNCTIGMYVNGETIDIEIVNSKTTVTSKEVAEALEKHGYICDHIEFE